MEQLFTYCTLREGGLVTELEKWFICLPPFHVPLDSSGFYDCLYFNGVAGFNALVELVFQYGFGLMGFWISYRLL